ncbi:MAG TPA: TetR/AcrR family transcriptional regulator [Gemmatimonadaceae bacterium]|nr:TetR/AcrR family transcriptional regulator [Gemmatimonadaceae bacterium]
MSVERQRTVEAGRDRIVTAACELLDDDTAEGFSIDAVARRAGVARMTVYNQFESKAGLLEALFDALAQRGPLAAMADIFKGPDPFIVLDEYVALFGRFWTLNRRTHRRLRAAALHDDELAAAIANRNDRRRRGVTEIVRRLGDRAQPTIARDEVVNVIYVLLSFDTFDALAGDTRTPEQVAPIVGQLIRSVLQLKD